VADNAAHVAVTPGTTDLLERGLEVISASRMLVAESHALRERARVLRAAVTPRATKTRRCPQQLSDREE
jgi:hypothetical protein